MPASYFLHANPAEIAEHLRAVHALIVSVLADQPDAALSPQIRWSTEGAETLVQVVTWDRAGLFGRMAGAFAVAGINIMSCRAFSRSDHVAIDLFRVVLPTEQSDATRAKFVEALESTLVHEVDLRERIDIDDQRQARLQPKRRPSLSDTPVVRVYDAPELSRTVVEIQAPDRLGLLFRLGSTIRDAGYAITFANIATEKGYALDTFYLTPEPSVQSKPISLPALEAELLKVLTALPAFP
jgi:[protein-PII] uridylyltransferase